MNQLIGCGENEMQQVHQDYFPLLRSLASARSCHKSLPTNHTCAAVALFTISVVKSFLQFHLFICLALDVHLIDYVGICVFQQFCVAVGFDTVFPPLCCFCCFGPRQHGRTPVPDC